MGKADEMNDEGKRRRKGIKGGIHTIFDIRDEAHHSVSIVVFRKEVVEFEGTKWQK